MDVDNIVRVEVICYSNRTAKIVWQGAEYEVTAAIPTGDGKVLLQCHICSITGLLWQVKLNGTNDLKEGQLLAGEMLK